MYVQRLCIPLLLHTEQIQRTGLMAATRASGRKCLQGAIKTHFGELGPSLSRCPLGRGGDGIAICHGVTAGIQAMQQGGQHPSQRHLPDGLCARELEEPDPRDLRGLRLQLEEAEAKSPQVSCRGTGKRLRGGGGFHVGAQGDACVFDLQNWNPVVSSAPCDEPVQLLLFLNVGTEKDLSSRKLAHAAAAATGFGGQIVWDDSKPDGISKKQLDMSQLAAFIWFGEELNVQLGRL